MVKNKLGIYNYGILKQVEYEIVSLKINLLNDRMTFNMKTINLELLTRIHHFLFGDIYYDEYVQPRKLDKDEVDKINKLFQFLIKLGIMGNKIDIKLIEQIFVELWDLQIFFDGNTRTLLAFLKLYIEYYQLPIEMNDLNNIESDNKMFVLKLSTENS